MKIFSNMHNASGQQTAIKFSVIVPAYNAAATIERAISSCLAQSYPPHEIIVVDDHSSDHTTAIVHTFQPTVTLCMLEENRGPSHARNTGWDCATGDYVVFLDADDVWHKDKLMAIQSVLQKSMLPAFIFHSFQLQPLPDALPTPLPDLKKLPFRRLLWRIPPTTPCHPSTVALRSDLSERFEVRMRYMEDYDLWLRIASEHRVQYLPVPLTQLGRPVLSAGGQSSNRLAMRAGEFQAYLRLTKHRPQYLLLLPFLIGAGAIKHCIRLLIGK